MTDRQPTQELLSRVRADFQGHDYDVSLVEGSPGQLIVYVTISGETSGFGIDASGPAEQCLVEIADGIQRSLIDVDRAAVPTCLFHPDHHPAAARLLGGVATWVCPTTEQAIKRIAESPT